MHLFPSYGVSVTVKEMGAWEVGATSMKRKTKSREGAGNEIQIKRKMKTFE